MRILKHSASHILAQSQSKTLFTNNINTKIAIYSLAAMDVATSGGIICAAPTRGSCADLILGGYMNPIPFDEAIDASFQSRSMLPKELRCTAKGVLLLTKLL